MMNCRFPIFVNFPSSRFSSIVISFAVSSPHVGPIREIDPGRLLTLQSSEVRRIGLDDFRTALAKVRISVSAQDVAKYEEWNTRFGDVS